MGDMNVTEPWERREFLRAAAITCATLMMASRGESTPAVQPAGDRGRLTLSEASGLVRSRKISSVELTRACLAEIERLNPVLNAFITVTAERAMSDARAMDQELAKGHWRGPLHGIPIGIKDAFDTAGVRTTAASAIFAERIPLEDAEAVRRLVASGAVTLGKLNMHEFGSWDTSAQSHFGPVRNPWNRDVVAGGSSGGSAAAVASGMCYGALSTDAGGSIRQPSAFCGVVGLKPTYGRVSTRGMIPGAWSLDHVGPICRTVHDAALMLQALVGYDAEDINSVNARPSDYMKGMAGKTTALRLGIPRVPFFDALDPDIEQAVNEALSVLRRLTMSAREVDLPVYRGFATILTAEMYTAHASNFLKSRDLYQPTTRFVLESGAKVTAPAYINARRDLERVRRTVAGVFATVDALVTPVTPILPASIADALTDSGTRGARSLRNTSPFNSYGLPSISVPCGFSRNGLPIGLQITGPPLGESVVLAVARAYEQATNWHTRMPQT